MLKRFLTNCKGNVSVMLGLSVVPLLLAAGAGVDMIRANNAVTVLQGAADAAALAGAGSTSKDNSELQAIVEKYAQANNALYILDSIDTLTGEMDEDSRVFRVEIKGKLKTNFMFLAGISEMDIGAVAEVMKGGQTLELALVLDNTASMNSEGRLPALKVAAKALVDELMNNATAGSDVKIGIAPFSEYVNVGVSNINANWLTFPEGTSKTIHGCWNTYPNAVYYNCRDVQGTYDNDGVPTPYTYQQCDVDYGDPVEVCGTDTVNWQGCVGSRNNPHDENVSHPNIEYPGLLGVNCPSALTPLSNDKQEIKDKIDAMVATGMTYIAPGMIWGWNILTPDAPVTGAKTEAELAAAHGKKVIVLMTDGDNTRSANHPWHNASDQDDAEEKLAQVCNNVKDDNIIVFTVAFMVNDPDTVNLLKNCASEETKAFNAADSQALVQAFADIAGELATLRLSK